MIAIACASTDERAFRAGAARTIATLDEGSSLLLRRHGYDSIDRPYNEMLTIAAARDDLEAVVLVHQDAIVDDERDVLSTVRGLLTATPEVAVVGTVYDGPSREVAAASGTILTLSAWAVRNLHFDSAMGQSVDASAQDISLQARAEGRTVVASPLGVIRAWAPTTPAQRREQLEAMVALTGKWELGTLPSR